VPGGVDVYQQDVRVTSGKIAHVGHITVNARQISRAPLALLALGLAGCGAVAHGSTPSATQLKADFRGSPPPLARLHDQADRLLGGGARAFAAELRALHGYPLVVNKWGSWCPPCRQEFPIFQQVSARLGRRVAFLGDDVHESSERAAASWLRRFPVSYPSFADADNTVNAALGASSVLDTPVTYFYNASGKQVYFHFGPYLSVASLEHDIRFYLGA
jgi:cytochrome c biogenesis protein CcmG, thiol:disulfide interchange protein DsbE